ncbi:MAG: serine/threonine-protein phosphatase, partial [Desulfofustis sp.]|nr:serine/threonine-protein phosphatase [Desulfofustis sp.]
LEVDMIGSEVMAGDVFLLCTDGLSSLVTKDQIEEILSHELEPEIKAIMLIDQANFNGGTDNITAVLVEFKTP